MKLAKIIYTGAGIWGLLLLTPMYFLEERLGRDQPPAITHPELFYGFVGCALAWQVLFLLLARDPVRYRPLMPATFLEKATYGVATIVLFAKGRVPPIVLAFGLTDLVLLVLFVVAWRATASGRDSSTPASGTAQTP